jgi:beta-carotene 15,15'-dioxygenase
MEMVKNWTYKILETPTLISVFAGLSLVVWQWMNGSIPPSVQITFFALFIFITGIPHGAIDHLVEKETAERHQKPFNLLFFLVKYVSTMLFYGLMWYVLPSISLLFFIVISAWHFGETDIDKAPSKPLWNITRFIFGGFTLLWILLFHAQETTPILERISQNNSFVMYIWSKAVEFTIAIITIFLLLFTAFFYLSFKKDKIKIDKNRFLRLSFILILTYFLPLSPAFSLYFGGWHALCSFKTIHDYLLKNRENSENQPPIYSAIKVWTKTLFFTFLAFVSLAFGVWYWLHFLQTWDPLPLLFIFLSLITLPHLNVMHGMNKANI